MHWFACSLPEALWASCLWLFFFLCCTSRKDCFRFWNTFWIRISDWPMKWLLCFSLRSSARWNSWSAWCMAVGSTTSWAGMELEEAEFVCGISQKMLPILMTLWVSIGLDFTFGETWTSFSLKRNFFGGWDFFFLAWCRLTTLVQLLSSSSSHLAISRLHSAPPSLHRWK